jgi:hypothetical protein
VRHRAAILAAACLTLSAAAPSPPQDSSVEVRVSSHVLGPRRIQYHYTVLNGSAHPITTLLIGDDYHWGEPRLKSEPLGWDGDTVPASSFQAPPGWLFHVQPTEEESLIAIKWQISDPEAAVAPGGTLGGFGVIVEMPDPAYESRGVWTAYASGASPYYGSIRAPGPAGPGTRARPSSDFEVSRNRDTGAFEIRFAVPRAGPAAAEILDAAGRRVKRVLNGWHAAGRSSVVWNGRDESGAEAPPGIYSVKLRTPSAGRTARIRSLTFRK